MPPKNKIATDEQILKAHKKHDTHREAAESLGMATKTFSNRLSLMKRKPPEEPRPGTYTHSKSKRYFISCAVSGAPVDKKFYKSVQAMCDHLNAEQIYIPVQYNWSDVKTGKHVPTYDKKVSDNLLSEDIDLNKHLKLMGSVPLHATLQNPLTGLKHVSHNKSAVFAHPQRAMESVATPKSKLPKLLYTTGAITEPRYTRSKEGRKAQDHHTLGGLLVEVSNDKFFIFEITANTQGGFFHLTEYFSPNGVTTGHEVEAIYMADEHAEGYDEHVKMATYTGDNSMVRVLQPSQVVRGDVYNHGSDSHHERKNVLHRVIRAAMGKHSVKDELDQCMRHIEETTVCGYKNVIVASNHHEHLKKWLNEYNPHTGDPRNTWLYHQLNAWMISEALSVCDAGIDPFEMYCRRLYKSIYDNCVFVSTDEEYDIAGIDCSLHGHRGANGSRGSAINLSLGGQPVIIGHGHSPRIYRNVYQVGVGASELGYNKGYSGWMATHCVIYQDGQRSMLHIIDGEWML